MQITLRMLSALSILVAGFALGVIATLFGLVPGEFQASAWFVKLPPYVYYGTAAVFLALAWFFSSTRLFIVREIDEDELSDGLRKQIQ